MITSEDVLLSSVYHKSQCLSIKASLPAYCILLYSSIGYNDYFLLCCTIAKQLLKSTVYLPPARFHAPAFFFFPFYFPPWLPVLPLEGLHSLVSHLLCGLKGESGEQGRNCSCINPVEHQMLVGKAAFMHIKEKTPNTPTRMAPGTGHQSMPAG